MYQNPMTINDGSSLMSDTIYEEKRLQNFRRKFIIKKTAILMGRKEVYNGYK